MAARVLTAGMMLVAFQGVGESVGGGGHAVAQESLTVVVESTDAVLTSPVVRPRLATALGAPVSTLTPGAPPTSVVIALTDVGATVRSLRIGRGRTAETNAGAIEPATPAAATRAVAAPETDGGHERSGARRVVCHA